MDVLYGAVLDAGEQYVGRLRFLDAELAFQSEAWNLPGRREGGREGGREGHNIQREVLASSARGLGDGESTEGKVPRSKGEKK